MMMAGGWKRNRSGNYWFSQLLRKSVLYFIPAFAQLLFRPFVVKAIII
jgi:hypothetical protein